VGALPPSFGVAVNVIELPEQIDVEVAVIETEGVTELTVTVTGVLPLSQPLTV